MEENKMTDAMTPEVVAALEWAEKGLDYNSDPAMTLAQALRAEVKAREVDARDFHDLEALYEAEKIIKQTQWDYAREQKDRAEKAEAALKEAKEHIRGLEADVFVGGKVDSLEITRLMKSLQSERDEALAKLKELLSAVRETAKQFNEAKGKIAILDMHEVMTPLWKRAIEIHDKLRDK